MKDEGCPALRAIRHSSLITRHCSAALFAAVLTGCATASAGVEEAKRIVDRAGPMRCEVVELEAKLKHAPPGTDETAAAAAALEQARARLKYHYLATMDEYIAVMKELPFEERKAIYRYSDAAAERCVTR
jgi:hypothetical protein